MANFFDIAFSDKCYWCGTRTQNLVEIMISTGSKSLKAFVCSNECEHAFRLYVRDVFAGIRWFFLGLILVAAASLYITFMDRLSILGAFVVLAGLGVLIIAFPFVTSNTIEMMGAKKSILLQRLSGIVLIAMGVLNMLITPRIPFAIIPVNLGGLAFIIVSWIWLIRKEAGGPS